MKQLPIEAILDKMTTAEKANLCDGEGSWHTHGVERLGIPGAMMTDGPHGLRKRIQVNGEWTTVHSTCLPTASALAASWNREVAALAANTIAKEAVAESVSVVLGPGVNMKRSPLCGRNFEYFSEDPYFAGDFAAAYINAMQGNGVGSCIKHFAVNNQETRRFTVSANVAARPLHEIYLRAFEIAIERAKPEAIMESYNRINGKHAAESRWLLDDLLRKKWGFEGVVMSDWDAVNDRVASLEAGLDLEMPTSHGSGRDYILSALASGRIDEVLLDRSARRVLALAVKQALLQRALRAVFQHILQRTDGHIRPRRALRQQMQGIFVHIHLLLLRVLCSKIEKSMIQYEKRRRCYAYGTDGPRDRGRLCRAGKRDRRHNGGRAGAAAGRHCRGHGADF